MKLINRVSGQVIEEVTPDHFNNVLIRNGWEELVEQPRKVTSKTNNKKVTKK